jgi:hypothetical protein
MYARYRCELQLQHHAVGEDLKPVLRRSTEVDEAWKERDR